MPNFRHMPLGQLSLCCPPLLQVTSAEEQGAWWELQRRALVEQNPAAWDALLMRLWSSVLFWIYERIPDLAPAAAERVAQRAIAEFKRRQMAIPHDLTGLASHEALLADLQQVVAQLMADHP
ncbi:MAG: hypothetical protein R3E79_33290 [Caldilineaceae bacterium]